MSGTGDKNDNNLFLKPIVAEASLFGGIVPTTASSSNLFGGSAPQMSTMTSNTQLGSSSSMAVGGSLSSVATNSETASSQCVASSSSIPSSNSLFGSVSAASNNSLFGGLTTKASSSSLFGGIAATTPSIASFSNSASTSDFGSVQSSSLFGGTPVATKQLESVPVLLPKFKRTTAMQIETNINEGSVVKNVQESLFLTEIAEEKEKTAAFEARLNNLLDESNMLGDLFSEEPSFGQTTGDDCDMDELPLLQKIAKEKQNFISFENKLREIIRL